MSDFLQTKTILISVLSLTWWIYSNDPTASFYFPETSFRTSLIKTSICAKSQYWAMLGRLGFSLFQLKLSIIYTDNFCLVSLSYVERDNKKRKQNMFPFDFFVIDHFVANFDQKMLEKRDIKKNIFSMALGRTYAWISILLSATDTFRIN